MRNARSALFALLALLTVAAHAQFPAQGDDLTTSLGSFKIQIANNYQGLFAGCPAYDGASGILKSPTLFDPATRVGRSKAITDGDADDTNGIAVGAAGTVVSENMLFPPPGFPCAGVIGCTSGAGTREVHTEVRSLRMTSGPVAVRAGVWYDNPNLTGPPSRVSPGEVESQSGPNGAPANDFPASSFFDVFVQVDVPACGGFPGATLYNSSPLIVKNFNLTQFPPKVVYLHDASTVVPILFLNANPPQWAADDILGYFVLAGHGIGFTNSQADLDEFNKFMNCQNVSDFSTGSLLSRAASVNTVNDCIAPPPPSPSPTPLPSPSPTPSPSPAPSPSPTPFPSSTPVRSPAPQ